HPCQGLRRSALSALARVWGFQRSTRHEICTRYLVMMQEFLYSGRVVRRVLVSWVGKTDLRAPTETATVGLGPIAQALDARTFDEVVLVSDYPEAEVKSFLGWLKQRTSTSIGILFVKLSGPTNFGEIYEAATKACLRALGERRTTTALTCHLSPGTP